MQIFRGLPQFNESFKRSNDTAADAETEAEAPTLGTVAVGTVAEADTETETPIATHRPLRHV
jgi:hypothetical protein